MILSIIRILSFTSLITFIFFPIANLYAQDIAGIDFSSYVDVSKNKKFMIQFNKHYKVVRSFDQGLPSELKFQDFKKAVDGILDLTPKIKQTPLYNNESFLQIYFDLFYRSLIGPATLENPEGWHYAQQAPRSYNLSKKVLDHIISNQLLDTGTYGELLNTLYEFQKTVPRKILENLHHPLTEREGELAISQISNLIKFAESQKSVATKRFSKLINEEIVQQFSGENSTNVSARSKNFSNIRTLVQKAGNSTALSDQSIAFILNELVSDNNSIYERSYMSHLNAASASEGNALIFREKEARDFVKHLKRDKASHIVLVADAGSGKTSFMQTLQDAFFDGKLFVRSANEHPPIILNVSSLFVKTANASLISNLYEIAKVMAVENKTKVLLYIDGTDFTITPKLYLEKILGTNSNQSNVHFVFSTPDLGPLRENKEIFRHFQTLELPAISDDQILTYIESVYLGKLSERHGVNIHKLSTESLDLIKGFGSFERGGVSRLTSILEFVEGLVIDQIDGNKNSVSITPERIRGYVRSKYNLELIPGDPQFHDIFEKKWKKFDDDFVGNQGFKEQLKTKLRNHLYAKFKQEVPVLLLAGSPGAGKSYAMELAGREFFSGKVVILNGGDYQEKHSVASFIGSPPGYVGSKDKTSIWARHLDGNKPVLFIFEEADYLHSSIREHLVNAISSGEVKDAVNNKYSLKNCMFAFTTNIGQDRMLPSGQKHMDWNTFYTLKNELMQELENPAYISNKDAPQKILVPRQEILDDIVSEFWQKMIGNSSQTVDSSKIANESMKMVRRTDRYFVLGPEPKELIHGASIYFKKFQAEMKKSIGVVIRFANEVDHEKIAAILELDRYVFSMGFSYANKMMDEKIVSPLKQIISSQNLKNITIDINPEENLILFNSAGQVYEKNLVTPVKAAVNPWVENPIMRKRIDDLVPNMKKHLMGMDGILEDARNLFMQKMLDWDNTKMVFTLLGPSGNGKTEFAKTLATELYGSLDALLPPITASKPSDLDEYFRPGKKYAGGSEMTKFEEAFRARAKLGGVILLDELLSFRGLSSIEISQKVAIIKELYPLLDEQRLKFGGGVGEMDAKPFTIVFTGNLGQEFFEKIEDNPDAEISIKRTMDRMNEGMISRLLNEVGIDQPARVRLGNLYILPPVLKKDALKIGDKVLREKTLALSKNANKHIEITLSSELKEKFTEKVTSITQGVRGIKRGYDKIVYEPLSSLIFGLNGKAPEKVNLTLDGERIVWNVDGQEYIRVQDGDRYLWITKETHGKNTHMVDVTPSLVDVTKASYVKFSEQDKKIVSIHEVIGHFGVSYLLAGKNMANSLSIIPEIGKLGYMSYLDPDNIMKTLTALIEDSVMSEAGSRAVYKYGLTAPGGGTSRYTTIEKRSDDMGFVKRNIDNMLKQQFFDGINEFSSKKEKQAFVDFMFVFGKGFTDVVLEHAIDNAVVMKAYNDILEQKYLGPSYLDNIPPIDRTEVKDIFIEGLKYGVDNAKSIVESKGKNQASFVKYFEKEFVSKVLREYSTIHGFEYDALMRQYSALNIDCNRYLKKHKLP